ncbi:MAG TPA: DUF2510 domain-containing protein [Acidimicrobiales bacterium]|jgi:hypothetical protein|nr:DUF2510 domain-containing protein [Acidimicrobiales bacterium]
MADHADDPAASSPSVPPVGWYPDPSGDAQWRRWDGTSWGEATMPYGPPPPDAVSLQTERRAWLLLRGVAPLGLLAPALFAIALAADSATFGPLRRYVREWWNADLHHRPLPPVPATGSSSAVVSLTYVTVWLVSIVGIGAWLRFTLASSRVVAAARYPSRQHAGWTCVSFFIPVLGPLIARSASRAWLPDGHEARRSLGVGWSLVAAGELAVTALWATTLSTSSLAAAWCLAVVAAAVWVLAAIELPRGLEAIAEDHASLGVRRAPTRS